VTVDVRDSRRDREAEGDAPGAEADEDDRSQADDRERRRQVDPLLRAADERGKVVEDGDRGRERDERAHGRSLDLPSESA
jgi:hypothetical protein